jgi:formate hydrogenlyase transcriptional activator
MAAETQLARQRARAREHHRARHHPLSKGPTLRLDRDALPATEVTASLDDDVHQRERALIETALAACRGRISGAQGAARRLGLPASTLEFRIKRLGIDKFRHRR